MYALVKDGAVAAYPYSDEQLRKDNPNVSFPAELTNDVRARFGMRPLIDTTPPAPAPYEEVVEDTPVPSGARWARAYSLRRAQDPAEAFTQKRQALREAVKRLRDIKEEQGALTPFGPIDTGPASTKRLLALQGSAVATILTNTSWETISWTLADQTELTIDSPLKGLQLTRAVLSALNRLHSRARELKTAIDAVKFDPLAPDKAFAALDAIDIAQGWA